MLSYLAGAYTTTIAAGLAIVFSLHGSSVTGTSGHIASPAEEIAAGAIALTIALTIAFLLATGRDAPLRRWRERRKAAKASGGKAKQPWQQRMLGKGSAGVTFAIGAVMSFPGVTYLNALHHVVALNLPAVSILLLVMYFCLMQQILLELALLAFSFAPGRTQAVVVQFRAWLASHGHRIAAFGLAGIGTLLVVRGAVTIS